MRREEEAGGRGMVLGSWWFRREGSIGENGSSRGTSGSSSKLKTQNQRTKNKKLHFCLKNNDKLKNF